MDKLQAEILSFLEDLSIVSLVVCNPRNKKSEISKLTARPIHTQKGFCYQLSQHFAKKILHVNYSPSELLEFLWTQLGSLYKEAFFFTKDGDIQILADREPWKIQRKKASKKPIPLVHNRAKNHPLPEGEAVPFLVELGVMRADGSVLPKMAHKFRQINRFVEIIADVLPHVNEEKPLQIIDFGCGKSYLTFAIYHYLCNQLQREVEIIGLDLKEDVIAKCQALAEKLRCQHLHFQVGDINSYHPAYQPDLVVSLHACDTATDAALEKAILWKTQIILCVPCCQQELYKQIKNDALTPILKHGILRERFSALATDAARAQLLESLGYRTQVMEFIDMEHTPKNLLIRAIKDPSLSISTDALDIYKKFALALEINPSLFRRASKSSLL